MRRRVVIVWSQCSELPLHLRTPYSTPDIDSAQAATSTAQFPVHCAKAMTTNNDQCRITKDTSARKGGSSAGVRAAVEEAARKASEALYQERVIQGFEQQIEDAERKHEEQLKQLQASHEANNASLQTQLIQTRESAITKERKMLSEATAKAKADAELEVSLVRRQLLTTQQQVQEWKSAHEAATSRIRGLQEETTKLVAEHQQETAELRSKQNREMAKFHRENSTGPRQIVELYLSRPSVKARSFTKRRSTKLCDLFDECLKDSKVKKERFNAFHDNKVLVDWNATLFEVMIFLFAHIAAGMH